MMKTLPPTYFFGAMVLAVAFHFLLPLRRLLAFPWRLTGLVPLVVGILLNLLADKTFKKHDTTVKPFEKSDSLVISGVFGITRTPMYLGMTLVLLDAALLLGSLAPFAVVIVLPILLDCVFIAPEEKMLEDTFCSETNSESIKTGSGDGFEHEIVQPLRALCRALRARGVTHHVLSLMSSQSMPILQRAVELLQNWDSAATGITCPANRGPSHPR